MKKRNSNSKKTNSNNNNNDEDIKTKAELLKELTSLNQAITLTYIAIVSIILNLIYNYNKRAKVIDDLRGTTTAIDSYINNKYLIFSRKIALFVAIVSFKDSIDVLNSILCSYPIDEKDVEAARRSVLVSILALYAANLSLYNVISDDSDISRTVPVVEEI